MQRFAARTDAAGQTYRLGLAAERLGRDDYVVRVVVAPTTGGAATTARLTARHL